MRTAIVTDTNCGMTAAEAEELGVHLIPMPFFIGGETYYEGKDITFDLFFEKMRAGVDVSTSQPAPETVTGLWEELLRDHDAILHFAMSSGLSGTCQTATALAQEYGGRVQVVDDHRISVTLMQSIRNAKVLLDQGKTAQEVKVILEEEGYEASIYIALSTLDNLKKSGRITAAGAAMAAVLSIKPVLQIQGGKLDAYKKVRGFNQAKKVMIEALSKDLDSRFQETNVQLFVAYSGADPEVGEKWKVEVEKAFPGWTVECCPLPLSICCHTGEGGVGIGCAKKY